MDDSPPRPPPARARKPPPKLTPAWLENVALHYLQRYDATEARLRQVLGRRVDRALREHGTEAEQAQRWIEELVQKLLRNRLLDDARFAEQKAHALRRAGKSRRLIAQKLQAAGLDPALIDAQVAQAAGELSEVEAARIFARKRRLGPHRADPEERAARRRRDLAALARAGFSYATALAVLGERPEKPREESESE